jgi:hypothetical protein
VRNPCDAGCGFARGHFDTFGQAHLSMVRLFGV